IEWQNTIGAYLTENLLDIQQTIDGGYVLGGSSSSNGFEDKTEHTQGGFDYWVVKLDVLGNIEWDNTIGGNSDDNMFSINQTLDGGYILSGTSASDISFDKTENHIGPSYYKDYWIVKINESGEIEWQNTIGGDGSDGGVSARQTPDGGYILAGISTSDISGDKTEPVIGGCCSNDYWVVKLSPDPLFCSITSTITPSGPTTFCKPGSVILNAPIDASYIYQWKKNGVDIPGATSSSYTSINTTANYQVYITNGTCDDISDSLLITANMKPNAVVNNLDATNDLCFDESIKLKANNGAGLTYQWFKGATPISGATTQIFFATTPGNYKVRVTNTFGCMKISLPYSIIETCRMGNDTDSELAVNVYPNPAHTELFIQTTGFNAEEIKVNMYNSTGQKIFSVVNNNTEIMQINISEFPAGIYTVLISDNDQTGVKQFVKE
ncbi:MAG: T9SS type A sorting domain-containing protein, partial [Chitinophagales bacterium]|nr:T9SS type A sorting domain-containing protein [Chitinophagales bacterium]